MKLIRLVALMAVTLAFIACSQSQTGAVDEKYATDETPANIVNEKQQLHSDNDTIQFQKTGNKQQQKEKQTGDLPDWDKKIIKTAILNVEVEDYDKFYSGVRQRMKELGGYIAQEEQLQTDYKIQNSLLIKVPVDRFDDALVQATTNAKTINEKKVTSQDVTTDVVDTKSRMEAKKNVRDRYMDLLRQAKNMAEILNVQAEINAIQVEIESAAGRINYLDHSSAYSTIHLTYFEVLNATAKDNESPSFAQKLSHAFGSGLSWFADLFVGLVSIWPLYLLIFVCIIIYKRLRLQKVKAIKSSNS